MLDALMALLAWAHDPKDRELPLLTVRVQLWMRELRPLVPNVVLGSNGDGHGGAVTWPALRSAADLKAGG